jgi:3-deoxy-D-arabino-heptulosonate 7-phosphate (DAHP) synthase class II
MALKLMMIDCLLGASKPVVRIARIAGQFAKWVLFHFGSP